MRCLIVEDDVTCRRLLQLYLSDYAACVVACDGQEAVAAFAKALVKGGAL
jgi:DNA-binding response OmpR family regulator